MTQRAGTTVDIAWLLNDLAGRLVHVQHAAVLSNDGLLIAKSHGLSREEAEHLSARVGHYLSTPVRAARNVER